MVAAEASSIMLTCMIICQQTSFQPYLYRKCTVSIVWFRHEYSFRGRAQCGDFRSRVIWMRMYKVYPGSGNWITQSSISPAALLSCLTLSLRFPACRAISLAIISFSTTNQHRGVIIILLGKQSNFSIVMIFSFPLLYK